MTKKIFNISLLISIGAILTGCATYGPYAKRGTATGGTTGVLIGAVVGHQSDETDSGAFASAAISGLWGSVRDWDENERDDKWEPEFEPL